MTISYQWLSEWLEEAKQSVGPFYEEVIKKVWSTNFCFYKVCFKSNKIKCSKILLATFKASLFLKTVYSPQTLTIAFFIFFFFCFFFFFFFFLLYSAPCSSTFWRLKQLKNISTAVHYASLQSKHVYFSLLRQNDSTFRAEKVSFLCLLSKLFSGIIEMFALTKYIAGRGASIPPV